MGSWPGWSRPSRRWHASETSTGSSSRGRPGIELSPGRSAIASALRAGSEVDADEPPRAPVAGPVARSDTDLAVVPSRPGDALAGGRRRCPRGPRAADAAPLDLEVAQPCREDLQADVPAGPADRHAHAIAVHGLLADGPEPGPGPGLVGFLDEEAGVIELAARRLGRTVADVVVAGRDHDVPVA